MNGGQGVPVLRQVVLDGTDIRTLAEFYRQLLGLRYRPGDEPPPPGRPDAQGEDWLVLRGDGGVQLAFQQVASLPEATWPEGPVPQQLHLDLTVPGTAELDVQHERAMALGARLLDDQSEDPEEVDRVQAAAETRLADEVADVAEAEPVAEATVEEGTAEAALTDEVATPDEAESDAEDTIKA